MKNYFGIIKILISSLLIYFVFKDIDFKEYLLAIKNVSLSRFLIMYLFISMGNVAIYAIKMNKIYLNNSLSFLNSIKYILYFRFYNLVAPIFTPVIKFRKFKKINKSKEAITFILSEKIIENFIYSIFILIIFFKNNLFTYIIFLTLVLISYYVFKEKFYLFSKLAILLALSRLFSAIGLYLIVQNFTQGINYLDILFINILTTLVLSFPISFGGLGIREITLSRLLAEFLDDTSILVVSNLLFLILLINGLLGFLLNIKERDV